VGEGANRPLPRCARACAVAGGAPIVGATHRRNRRTIVMAIRTRNPVRQTGAIRAMRRPRTWINPTGEAFREPGYQQEAHAVHETGLVELSGIGNTSPLQRGIAPGAGIPCPAGGAPIVGATHRRNRRTIVMADRTRNPGTPIGAIRAMRRPRTWINPTGEAFREPGYQQEAHAVHETGLVELSGIGNASPLQRGIAPGAGIPCPARSAPIVGATHRRNR
jgi:hypothetical protein